ncbi:MAG: phenylphosphate carboxylase subunit beta [Rhodospirillales bacterium]|jgi:4-hydroxy-3-polyprenylbenzoate decarboxylase|nr:phenylphosphate carboxylase subunit beta [Rhodospirillales bacterium]
MIAINDLQMFAASLEERGLLHRIKAPVDRDLELAHVAVMGERAKGPALIFDNVIGFDIPILISAFTSPSRMAVALGMEPGPSMPELSRLWMERTTARLIPPVTVNNAMVAKNQLTGDDVDVNHFPAPQLYPKDGGRFFGTTAYLVCRDPETGWVNLGTYRMQILEPNRVGVQFLQGKDADHILKKYKARGEKMPAAAVLGGDPLLFLASATFIGTGISELDIVGALRQKPVEVWQSDLTGLPLPAGAEIVLEGHIDPDDPCHEGPLGEYTGYYTHDHWSKPALKIQRILHRDQPLFWSCTVGKPVNDIHMLQCLSRTGGIWHDLETMKIPGIESVYVPPEACGWFWTIVSIRQMYPGHANQVGNAVLASSGGHHATKGVIVVDHDIAADDLSGVWWALSTRFDPSRSLTLDQGRATKLDPSLPYGDRHITGRMIINACIPYEWEEKPEQVELDAEMVAKVKARWADFDMPDIDPNRIMGI